jgi:predicted aspartyl protease
LSSFEFPLLGKLTPFGEITDPTIPLVVHTVAGSPTYQFLLDTGADFSAAPRHLAHRIGLDWNSLPTARVVGVGVDATAARLGTLPLVFGGIELPVRCLFLDIPAAPFVLGRADVLEHFAITLDAGSRRITFTELGLNNQEWAGVPDWER